MIDVITAGLLLLCFLTFGVIGLGTLRSWRLNHKTTKHLSSMTLRLSVLLVALAIDFGFRFSARAERIYYGRSASFISGSWLWVADVALVTVAAWVFYADFRRVR
jgi:hypothetical protein